MANPFSLTDDTLLDADVAAELVVLNKLSTELSEVVKHLVRMEAAYISWQRLREEEIKKEGNKYEF